MLDDFAIRIFYADGGPPESGKRRISDLSPKWMAICDDLLASYGPVLNHNMGSTLSHFDIAMVGPMVVLKAFGQLCFRLAISLGTGSEQDHAAVSLFREIWSNFVNNAGNNIDPAALPVIDQAAAEPCVLVLDACHSLQDDQKLALAQLGEHLAGAYFKYCAASRPAVN